MAYDSLAYSHDFFLDAADGERIYVKAWPLSPSATRGVIQIAHGLGETADYYDEFSQVANRGGFAVYILEARGHGRTAGDVTLPTYTEKGGDIGENGFLKIRDDHYQLTQTLKVVYDGKPLFLLGHSFGSTIARLYAFSYGEAINGLILTGAGSVSPYNKGLLASIGQEIAENGPKAPSKTTFERLFQNLNKPFEPAATALDWITSDPAMIEASLKLPYTYVLFNNHFYQQMLQVAPELERDANLQAIPKTLPILLLSGSQDVITQNGQITTSQAARFKATGLQDIEYKLYEGQRHSILREINRAEVFSDIFGWIEAHL